MTEHGTNKTEEMQSFLTSFQAVFPWTSAALEDKSTIGRNGVIGKILDVEVQSSLSAWVASTKALPDDVTFLSEELDWCKLLWDKYCYLKQLSSQWFSLNRPRMSGDGF